MIAIAEARIAEDKPKLADATEKTGTSQGTPRRLNRGETVGGGLHRRSDMGALSIEQA